MMCDMMFGQFSLDELARHLTGACCSWVAPLRKNIKKTSNNLNKLARQVMTSCRLSHTIRRGWPTLWRSSSRRWRDERRRWSKKTLRRRRSNKQSIQITLFKTLKEVPRQMWPLLCSIQHTILFKLHLKIDHFDRISILHPHNKGDN